jgi:hypothetical protein
VSGKEFSGIFGARLVCGFEKGSDCKSGQSYKQKIDRLFGEKFQNRCSAENFGQDKENRMQLFLQKQGNMNRRGKG